MIKRLCIELLLLTVLSIVIGGSIQMLSAKTDMNNRGLKLETSVDYSAMPPFGE